MCPSSGKITVFFYWSHPDVFSLSIPRVSSVKTELFYCQLKWRHVSTQVVIIRSIIEPCLRYIKWDSRMFTTVKERRKHVATLIDSKTFVFWLNLLLEYLETTVSIRHLVLVTLYGWLSGMQGAIPPCIPDSHPHRVTRTKCRIDTVISPDDGHIVARNMERKEINILRKTVHQVGFIYKIIQRCRSTEHKI
jgi:hypothetical protein